MSKFLSSERLGLTPYTPGEQPQNIKFIKLNTNESPFMPSPKAVEYAAEAAKKLNLYPDPECRELTESLAKTFEVMPENVITGNGSDEILSFAFMAFCGGKTKAVFPDITYGFYKVFAELYNVEYEEIPLDDDFGVNICDYCGCGKTVFIANPNAPTGIMLPISEIEKLLCENRENVVVIDEAYVDFGSESCARLIKEYENLLVVQTFSKSRSLAGGRLGFGIASKQIIGDLKLIKYSTNPYNVNKMTMAAGLGSLSDSEYTLKNCGEIIKNREQTILELKKLGFETTNSKANFVFAKHPEISGEKIYEKLKAEGILVRHFCGERIKEFNRITVGTREQMSALLAALGKIVSEEER